MTVCIAAMCVGPDGPLVVCAADQMVTAGDIEFEPSQAKYHAFSLTPAGPTAAALIAGDNTAQITICSRAMARLSAMPGALVEEVAAVYAEEFQAYRRIAAEANYLKPLGLDSNTFVSRQSELSPSIAQDLVYKLTNSGLDASSLIVGRDVTGAHIFAVHDPGEVFCADAIGFAAVGTGRRHAEAQFCLAGYSQHDSYGRALLLTYRAKKRAEVSPGVGPKTNMFVVTNTFSSLDNVIFSKIEEAHDRLETLIKNFVNEEEEKMKEFLPAYLKGKAQAAAQLPGDPMALPSPDAS